LNPDWYSFLDPKFAICKSQIKRRDKAVAVCSICGYRSVVIVNNLIVQIQRLGTHICFSCSAKKGSLSGKLKREQTMLKKYGAENPQQVDKFKEKRKKTMKIKYLHAKKIKQIQEKVKQGENYQKLWEEVFKK
jgi:hypothetical protein